MGPHTTSDDPTRYRDKEEVERWRERDPLQRLETYLRAQGAFDEAFAAEVAAAANALAAEVRAAALGATTRDPLTLLDNVYAEPHVGIDEQRERFGAYLDGFADAATDAGGAGR